MKTLEQKPDMDAPPAQRPQRSDSRYWARRVTHKVGMYGILLVLTAVILLPVSWALTAALKPDLEPVFTPTPEWFPSEFWEWGNFRRVLTEVMPFLRYMINTMIIVIASILGVLIM